MKNLSRPVTSGELALGILTVAALVGSAHGLMLSNIRPQPEGVVAAVATGAEATQQAASSGEVKSSAPQSCTEAISRALGKDRDPAATTVDKGQSGKLDACFGAVIKKGKKPSQNQADYDCVGRSGKVTLASGSVTSNTNPNSSVPKGKCSVQVCQSSGSAVQCGDPKTADGTASIPKYEPPASSGGTSDPKNPDTPIQGAGEKNETLDGAFKDSKPDADQEPTAPDQATQDAYRRIAERYGVLPPSPEGANSLGAPADVNQDPVTGGTLRDTMQQMGHFDTEYSLGQNPGTNYPTDMNQYGYTSPAQIQSPYDVGSNWSGSDWMSDVADWGVIESPDVVTDVNPGAPGEGFEGGWRVDSTVPDSSFEVSPHEITDFNGPWNPETGQTPSIGAEPSASMPQFDPAPVTTPGSGYEGLFGNAPTVPPQDFTAPSGLEKPDQIWSDSWWQSSEYGDLTTPDTSLDLPRSEWDPKITLPSELTDADRIAAYEVTLPYDAPTEFKDRVGQSGIFSTSVDITEPPAHIATEFNPNLRTDIVASTPGTASVPDPWSPKPAGNDEPIDVASLSAGFSLGKTSVPGLPPLFTIWGQTTFVVR